MALGPLLPPRLVETNLSLGDLESAKITFIRRI